MSIIIMGASSDHSEEPHKELETITIDDGIYR